MHDPVLVQAKLESGDLARVEAELNDSLRTPNGDLPSDIHRTTAIRLMDRAVVRLALGRYEAAARDFRMADETVDVGEMKRVTRSKKTMDPKFVRQMFTHGWAQAANMPYGAKVYERLLLNPLSAIAHSESGDASGACVEARRFGVMEEWTSQIAPQRAKPSRRFGELVTVMACEASGDTALACAAWKRAQAFEAAGKGTRIESECEREPSEDDGRPVDLWIVAGYGHVPVTSLEHAAPASTEESPDVVKFDALSPKSERLEIRVDDRTLTPFEVLDVGQEVRADFLAAHKAVTVRMLGQTATTGQWSPDAWEVLPAHIHAMGARVSRGRHRIRIRMRGKEHAREVLIGNEPAKIVSFWELR